MSGVGTVRKYVNVRCINENEWKNTSRNGEKEKKRVSPARIDRGWSEAERENAGI